MRKITLISCLLFFTVYLGQNAFAQDAGTQQSPKTQNATSAQVNHFYRLDFAVEEVGGDGKPTNSRSYSTIVVTDSHEVMSIRTGSRVPIVVGNVDTNGKEGMQFQYQDLGVNFDVRELREIGRQLSLNLTAVLSGLAGTSESVAHQPIIRQNRWQGYVLIPTGKPTVVFSSDSLDSKGSTRILVTATPLQ
jgi:hypothetical protein